VASPLRGWTKTSSRGGRRQRSPDSSRPTRAAFSVSYPLSIPIERGSHDHHRAGRTSSRGRRPPS
jgi:hypothetical protein